MPVFLQFIFLLLSTACQNSKAGKGKKLFGKLSSTKEDSDSDKGVHTQSTMQCSMYTICVLHNCFTFTLKHRHMACVCVVYNV